MTEQAIINAIINFAVAMFSAGAVCGYCVRRMAEEIKAWRREAARQKASAARTVLRWRKLI